jgi:putative CocE/NonD family hydrolase
MNTWIACLAALILAGTADAAGYDVTTREVWISMRDGVRLSATLHMPAAQHRGEKFPAVLEYLPYRKDEFLTHLGVHDYFARRGFVTAQVDIRGTGRSEGTLVEREYSEQEQRDGEEVIAWLGRQRWSNGAVGMFGISWGGFNSLQLAMRNPPGLKAIIAICATEDLYSDQAHFNDGMMHVDEYELNVDMANAMTRAPDFPTDDASLAPRFDTPPWIITYKQHARDGAFWDSPERPLASIRVPVFLIGGMLDGYRDSIPRMLQQVKAPIRALLGPWNHSEPDAAVPGPAVEWRDQAVEWWNQWLRGKSAPAHARLEVYMNHWYAPDLNLREIPGEWRAERSWPPEGSHLLTLFLGADHALRAVEAVSGQHELAYHPAATTESGGPDFWWGDINGDQRSVDAYSLVYDSLPLGAPLSILGRPRACLMASASAPAADWFVRLSDVAPDGTTTLVAGAGINGAQRDSARDPRPLVPGREYALCLDLHLASWVFPRGHRLHVAISNSMWPMVWPTPYPMTTSLRLGGAEGSRIELPVVPARGPLPIPMFATPEAAANKNTGVEDPAGLIVSSNVPGLLWEVSREPAREQASVTWRGATKTDFPWGQEAVQELMQYHADDRHPQSSSVHGEAQTTVRLKERELEWRAIIDTRSDAQNFYIDVRRELFENHKQIRQKSWQATVPRDNQ